MKVIKGAVVTLGLLAAGSAGAMAQATYDNDGQPLTPQTKTQPVTPAPSNGASSGDTGVSSPAGIPADPTTNENVQPGPSTNTPNDPAAGSNPGARAPTSPAGTGTSSP
ncbi:hypothetical protein [Hyphomicrobium facile]|uniref:Uncharacterized protein n=1 Tax=Hyphomicrobium facile TaxID=51670 RepID=A0A1I7NBG9_9HYPH|nr:hypothetical protein [Hyphomicrobium facile]SFV32015.1 hypothetical protein SAMN04488557_1465 [Hyphomicrobium facile]